MSDYQFEVGKEYQTRNGLPCVILANDPVVGMVWRVLSCGGEWTVVIGRHAADDYKPVPPEHTVEQRHAYDKSGHVVRYISWAARAVPMRWTIGSDGKPAYAVRLDDDGEPMYEVTRRGE